MQKYRSGISLFAVIVLAISLQSCSAVRQLMMGTSTPANTATPTATFTPIPTDTPVPTPTATPNLAATQEYNQFFSLVQKYYAAKYISSLAGTYSHLADYSDSYANKGSYHWSKSGLKVRNFILKSHVSMSAADASAIKTGCGVAFRTFGDFANVAFIQQNGTASYSANNQIFYSHQTSKLSNPSEFDLVLIANEKKLRLYINEKEAFVYETFLDTYIGDLGFSVISGSSKDFGSRCDFTNTELWEIN